MDFLKTKDILMTLTVPFEGDRERFPSLVSKRLDAQHSVLNAELAVQLNRRD